MRLWWTAGPADTTSADVADLIKAQLLMQGVRAATVVLLSPVRVHSRNLQARWYAASRDVWVVFSSVEDRMAAMNRVVNLWAGDCMLRTVAEARQKAGVALTVRLESKQMREPAPPPARRTQEDRPSGDTQCNSNLRPHPGW